MADSTRKKVVDAIVTAVRVTGVNLSTDDKQEYAKKSPSNVPSVLVMMGPAKDRRIAFEHSTAMDMEAEALVTLDGDVKTQYQDGIDEEMDSIIALITTAMSALSVSGVTVLDSSRQSIDYDIDSTQGYGIFRAVFRVRYLYNHLVP